MVARDFLEELEKLYGDNHIKDCYQCGNCSAGCPVTPEMDIMPSEIMRFIQLGFKDKVLKSKTIWICASCMTCSTRCPQEVHIAETMDKLRMMALRYDIKPAQPEVAKFNKIFLDNIKTHGRLFELTAMGFFNLLSGHLFQNFTKIPIMLTKNKLDFFPSYVEGIEELKELFDKVKQIESIKK